MYYRIILVLLSVIFACQQAPDNIISPMITNDLDLQKMSFEQPNITIYEPGFKAEVIAYGLNYPLHMVIDS